MKMINKLPSLALVISAALMIPGCISHPGNESPCGRKPIKT